MNNLVGSPSAYQSRARQERAEGFPRQISGQDACVTIGITMQWGCRLGSYPYNCTSFPLIAALWSAVRWAHPRRYRRAAGRAARKRWSRRAAGGKWHSSVPSTSTAYSSRMPSLCNSALTSDSCILEQHNCRICTRRDGEQIHEKQWPGLPPPRDVQTSFILHIVFAFLPVAS